MLLERGIGTLLTEDPKGRYWPTFFSIRRRSMESTNLKNDNAKRESFTSATVQQQVARSIQRALNISS